MLKKGDDEYNDPSCQCMLGELFLTGEGNIKDPWMAIHYFEKAAIQQNQAKPCYFLGIIYLALLDKPKLDYEKASDWFDQAGEIDSNCFIQLGKAYMHGFILFPSSTNRLQRKITIDKDYQKAIEWFSKALEKNNNEAYVLIAQAHFEGGYGIEKDYRQAIDWCNMGIEHGEVSATHCRDITAQIYSRGGYGIIKNTLRALNICSTFSMHFRAGMIYETEFDPPSYKDAVVMYKKLRYNEAHYAEAIERLGWFYHKGLGVEKDDNMACSMFFRSRACANRNYYFGLCFQKGINCKINHEIAYSYYQHIEEDEQDKKYGCALHRLGELVQVGFLESNDKDRAALAYFEKAAAVHCHHAFNSLGDAYKYGHGVTIDYEKAFHWYTKAAAYRDDCEGQFNLGMMYLEGKGTEINYSTALIWLKKARRLGNTAAKKWFIEEGHDFDDTGATDTVTEETMMLKKELYNVLNALELEKQKVIFLTEELRIARGEQPSTSDNTSHNDESLQESPPAYLRL